MTVTSKFTLKCEITLNTLAEEKTVELPYTPEHREIRSNEKADYPANQGSG